MELICSFACFGRFLTCSTTWTSVDCHREGGRLEEMMTAPSPRREAKAAAGRAATRPFDSLGWPEGAKAIHEGPGCRSCSSELLQRRQRRASRDFSSAPWSSHFSFLFDTARCYWVMKMFHNCLPHLYIFPRHCINYWWLSHNQTVANLSNGELISNQLTRTRVLILDHVAKYK